MKVIIAKIIFWLFNALVVAALLTVTIIIPVKFYIDFHDKMLFLIPIGLYIVLPLVVWTIKILEPNKTK